MPRVDNALFDLLKSKKRPYSPDEIAKLLSLTNGPRALELAEVLARYIKTNLPKAINRRSGLAGYRTNPYVLMASASTMGLGNPAKFADFLFNTKLYMGLETSFGKSIESAVLKHYPVDPEVPRWSDPPEKVAESRALKGVSNQEKARRRTTSVWRETDRSCVINEHRYLVTIKSGPNCINDSQVEAMQSAVARHHKEWLQQTKHEYPKVKYLDYIIGLTYGTEKTTNNKENQILAKLLEHGFVEEDPTGRPGCLIDEATGTIRVYRAIGQEFWAVIGNPLDPTTAGFVFVEVLLAVAKALSDGLKAESLEDRLNLKIAQLSVALQGLMFPRNGLPDWAREELSEDELFWFATAMTAFFDQGV